VRVNLRETTPSIARVNLRNLRETMPSMARKSARSAGDHAELFAGENIATICIYPKLGIENPTLPAYENTFTD